MIEKYERKPFDLDAYIHQIQNGSCFICEMIAGRRNGNHIIYQDDTFIAWLNKYPSLYGQALVAPIAHREQVAGDFTLDEYLTLQSRVYQAAEAVRRSVPAERIYLLSLGSQQGNRHVHWHIAPLPSGIPYQEQQLEALRVEAGILNLPDNEMEALAEKIRRQLEPLLNQERAIDSTTKLPTETEAP